MASIGALGFIKGATGYALDSIQSRQKEEADIRKAKMLEELRASTAKDLANFEDLLKDKEVDDKLSGFDNNEFVMRNRKGSEISRRAATAAETAAQQYEQKKQTLSLEGAELDIANTRSTIASRALDDRRQDRESGARISSYGRTGSLDGSDSRTASSIDVAALVLNDYEQDIKAAQKSGVPFENIRSMAEAAAAQSVVEKKKRKMNEKQAFDLARAGFRRALLAEMSKYPDKEDEEED